VKIQLLYLCNEQEILRILNEQQVKIGTPINALNSCPNRGFFGKDGLDKKCRIVF